WEYHRGCATFAGAHYRQRVPVRNGGPDPMSEDVVQRVLNVIASTQRIPVEQVTLESSFVDLNIDSMDAVNILFGLENEFDISIPDEDAKTIRDVRQMAEGVEKLLATRAARA